MYSEQRLRSDCTGLVDQKVNKYDQEIPQSHTADQPKAR